MNAIFKDLGFKIHLGVYLGVNLLLAVINLLTEPQILWFLWPLAGWGIGIAGHAAAIYYSCGRPVTLEQVTRARLAARG